MRDHDIQHILSYLLPGQLFDKVICKSINAGKNNRAYHIQLDGKDFFLKQYNPVGDRNRLESEYQFITYAHISESAYIAKPIACNQGLSVGLYEYHQGDRYVTGNVNDDDINHAIHFLSDLNKMRDQFPSCNVAQEACFSIVEHIDCVDRRVRRLNSIIAVDDIDRRAVRFVDEQLKPAWFLIKNHIEEICHGKRMVLDRQLCNEDRIISPSDFGFHNALKLPNNKIIFVDFEYAGWDDPAKLIGDFFNQVEVPIARSYLPSFAFSISKLVKNAEEMLSRAEILLPIYCIKWCCIILNYFLPNGRIMKSFSRDITKSVRENQLQKAEKHLLSLRNRSRMAINE